MTIRRNRHSKTRVPAFANSVIDGLAERSQVLQVSAARHDRRFSAAEDLNVEPFRDSSK